MSSLKDPRGLLSERREEIGRFLRWALDAEAGGRRLRWRERPDILEAKQAAASFSHQWWGLVVYSCFMSEIGAAAVATYFREPIDPDEAVSILASLELPKGAVKSHRTQAAGHTGAKTALVSACSHAAAFRAILLGTGSFHDRYKDIGALRASQWGRTTRYDLVLRAGALRVAGYDYEPDRAYLGESTGPRKGFAAILGVNVTSQNAAACEAILRAWTENWWEVADEACVQWTGEPYGAGDFENALCIYQEGRH